MRIFDYILGVFIMVIICLLCIHMCQKESTRNVSTSHSDTLYAKSKDTWHFFPITIPESVKVVHDTVPMLVDTAKILGDYFSRIYYNDTIRNDSIEISIREALFKNRIESRNLKYKFIAKQMIVEKTVTSMYDRQNVFVGTDAVLGKSTVILIPSIYFDTRHGLFGAGYDPINKNIKAGVYLKIGLWKRK